MGYRIFNIDEIIQYFRQANIIERVVFTLETGESLRSGRKIGGYMELILDHQNPEFAESYAQRPGLVF